MTTNLERIRQMNSDELAQWLFFQNNCCCDFCIISFMEDCNINCTDGIKQWLEKEVEE